LSDVIRLANSTVGSSGASRGAGEDAIVGNSGATTSLAGSTPSRAYSAAMWPLAATTPA